jgi:hypothetical protein
MATASTPAATSGFGRAIDTLIKAANFTPIKQEVTLADGSEFSFYAAPLKAIEREKAQKDAKTDGANDFAMQLLINKALNENGEQIFKAGDIPALKREIEDEDLQKLILCVLKPRGESGDNQPDMKSAKD